MSQKRQPEEGKSQTSEGIPSSPGGDKRRRFHFTNVVQEAIKMQSVQHLLEPILEPLIRRVVKEEIELALKKHLANMRRYGGTDMNSPESRSYKLQFSNCLSLPVFTGARIEGEECSPLKLVLIDALTGEVVSSGAESSAKVEMIVLEGDFDGDEGGNWTLEEFKNNIVREREGKKPLLMGDVFLNLEEGIGSVGEISFTDNSSWTRSRKFKLGARVVDCFDGARIHEAKTESFIVRDHRGELYKKHHPPSLFDEVWRLEKIGKDGAFHKRLSWENVNTVKDFLTLLSLDPTRLRHILGTGMSAKMWEVTLEHARTCVLDKRMYLYYPAGSQPKTGVVFNIVGQVMGLLSEGQYVPIDNLSESEKVDAQNLVIAAFEHQEAVVQFDDVNSLTASSSCLSNILNASSSSPNMENADGSKLLASQKMNGFEYAQSSVSSPDIVSSIYTVGGLNGLDDYALHGIENMGLRYDHSLSFPGQASNPLICNADSMAQAFCGDDHLQFFDTDIQSQNLGLVAQADLQSAVDGFMLSRNAAAAAVSIDKAQRRWKKISSVLKWFSIRRLVASRRTTHVPEIHRYYKHHP